MIEASLLGGLLGGFTRLAPEILKHLDRRGDRKHEKEMFELQLKADELRAQQALAVADKEVERAQVEGSLAAINAAISAQSMRTGNALLDGINILVRPTVTYTVFAMWVAVKLVALIGYGETMTLVEAMPLWWTDSDQAMLSAILNFWFLGRVFDKALGG